MANDLEEAIALAEDTFPRIYPETSICFTLLKAAKAHLAALKNDGGGGKAAPEVLAAFAAIKNLGLCHSGDDENPYVLFHPKHPNRFAVSRV